MKMFRKDEGFTLVELMVVVLIIGILVAIAIPVFNAASASARLRTCQANQRTIEGGVQQFLAASPSNVWAAGAATPLKVAGYLKKDPTCPTTSAIYHVDASGTVDSDQGASGTDFVSGHTHF